MAVNLDVGVVEILFLKILLGFDAIALVVGWVRSIVVFIRIGAVVSHYLVIDKIDVCGQLGYRANHAILDESLDSDEEVDYGQDDEYGRVDQKCDQCQRM